MATEVTIIALDPVVVESISNMLIETFEPFFIGIGIIIMLLLGLLGASLWNN